MNGTHVATEWPAEFAPAIYIISYVKQARRQISLLIPYMVGLTKTRSNYQETSYLTNETVVIPGTAIVILRYNI